MERLTQSHAAVSAGDVLRHNVALMRLSGAWPPEVSRDRGWSRLYRLYTASVFLSHVACIAMGLRHAFDSWGDTDSVMLTFVNTATLLGGVAKLAHFCRHVDEYRQLVSALRDLVSAQWPHCRRDDGLMAVFGASYRKALRLTFGMISYLHFVGPIWYLMPVVAWATGGEARQLPFINLRGAWKENLPLYLGVYLVQCHAIFFWCFISPSLDMFFVTCMLHVAAQLGILNERLCRMGGGLAVYGDETVALPRGRRKITDCERHLSQSDMPEELRNCIKNHQQILSFLQVLQRVMSPVAMAQFACSSVSICITLFQATCNPEGNSSLKCFMYLPMPALQIYIYCYGGHELIDQGLAVSLSAYSCGWVGATRRVTSSLHIMMCRAQKPLLLTAGKLYPINRITFVSLLNASYSFYTLLRQTRDR